MGKVFNILHKNDTICPFKWLKLKTISTVAMWLTDSSFCETKGKIKRQMQVDEMVGRWERIFGEAHNSFSNKDEAKSLVEEKVSDSKSV